MGPTYPKGTPEYDAYRAELRAELDKFVAGEPPYEYEGAADQPMPCIAKVGKPFHMRECGKPCEFLTAEHAHAEGLQYSGWRHADRSTGHGAVPRSFL